MIRLSTTCESRVRLQDMTEHHTRKVIVVYLMRTIAMAVNNMRSMYASVVRTDHGSRRKASSRGAWGLEDLPDYRCGVVGRVAVRLE